MVWNEVQAAQESKASQVISVYSQGWKPLRKTNLILQIKKSPAYEVCRRPHGQATALGLEIVLQFSGETAAQEKLPCNPVICKSYTVKGTEFKTIKSKFKSGIW